RHQFRCIALAITATTSIILGLAIVQPVQAATFPCAAGDVQCLIIAINHANANLQPQNTILLQAGTYTLTNIDNDTNGPNGLPSITSTMTIVGAGHNTATITRDPNALGFRLLHVGASGRLTLQNLTLSNGVGFFPGGGGLFNNGGVVSVETSAFVN